jgi:hypothetical protein
MGANAGVAAYFQSVCDGVKCVAVDVMAVGGWAAHGAFDKAERACAVREEVNVYPSCRPISMPASYVRLMV